MQTYRILSKRHQKLVLFIILLVIVLISIAFQVLGD